MSPLTREELAGLLPHGGTMRLIDCVESWDESTIRCRTGTHHDPENPLRQCGQLDAVAGLEYAAQAMGLHVGLYDPVGGRTGVIGYVGGVRDMQFSIERLDDCPATLVIDATRLFMNDQSFLYQFTVSSGDRTIMTGRASLFLKAAQS